ncbi:FAD-dependent oxidoreductase [Mesorhizobium sp.]|uniref:FAD-dependent oxidoreductase n=1 Tax=Mesorhizobium sp. TaxID=1871066 RepID=UPI000FD47E23|nr:FAD-dependent oxidoreductase [Mesorhizobium sp.]RVC61584.1 MOSC domain-containing protein [Mesorhizobium sp. M4B.F.Ca.ET.088.02.2.1]RWF24354.1 MAG: MOSC domain-containing protein [Mesorhizobium sp.]
MITVVGSVREIWRYPVSSLTGESLGRAMIMKTGVAGDRTHALFEASSSNIVNPPTSKKWNIAPRLAARVGDTGIIQISSDGRLWRAFDDPSMLDELEAIFGTRMESKRYGSQVGDAIAKPRYAMQPIHLLSRQSLDALQACLPDSQIDVRRFRPNIVVDLPDLAGARPEDSLLGKEFSIGALRLRGTVRCGRCAFTTLAQQGVPEDRSVLRTLIQDFEKNFGIYCEVLEPGEIAVGDTVSTPVAPEPQRPIVIVGAGQAGAMTAKALRDLGSTQSIQIFGEERHAPYERPPLSKGGDEGKGASISPSHVLTAAQIEDLNIDLNLNSRVVAVHRQTREIETQDGERHPYARLVLATGGSARRLRGLERGHGRVHVIRTIEDAANLNQSLQAGSTLCVLGSGWLGLEIAAAARKRLCDVTLFGRQNRVLARMIPSEVADYVAARHIAEGVKLRLGEVPTFRERPDHIEVTTASGVEKAEHLVLAIGISPNNHLARAAGLNVAGGVVTDESGATSDPDIFAVGDVARQQRPGYPKGICVESWHNANEQPYSAARALLSLPAEPLTPARFWSSQYDMMIQIAGFPDANAQVVRHEGDGRPFWDFGSFAIGINRSQEVHRFAAQLALGNAEAPTRYQASSKSSAQRKGPAEGVDIGPVDAFPEGEIRRLEIDQLGAVAIVQIDQRYFAVNDRCPHADASLSEGFIERDRIVCPLHFAEFDLQTGDPSNAPPGCGRLACYTVERRDHHLFLLF